MTDNISNQSHVAPTVPPFLDPGCPQTAALVEALRAHGVHLSLAIVDDSADDDAADIPHRDPGEIDPLWSAAIRRDPILQADHASKVRSMLLYLTGCYRPDLAAHPRLNAAANHAVSTLEQYQSTYAALPDAYARWDLLAGTFFEWVEELPRRRASRSDR